MIKESILRRTVLLLILHSRKENRSIGSIFSNLVLEKNETHITTKKLMKQILYTCNSVANITRIFLLLSCYLK